MASDGPFRAEGDLRAYAHMSYDDGMNVDRLSVTVPAELGAELRRVAQHRRDSVSNLVSEAIARELRLLALDDALRLADAQFGPVPEADVAKAMQALVPAAPVV